MIPGLEIRTGHHRFWGYLRSRTSRRASETARERIIGSFWGLPLLMGNCRWKKLQLRLRV